MTGRSMASCRRRARQTMCCATVMARVPDNTHLAAGGLHLAFPKPQHPIVLDWRHSTACCSGKLQLPRHTKGTPKAPQPVVL